MRSRRIAGKRMIIQMVAKWSTDTATCCAQRSAEVEVPLLAPIMEERTILVDTGMQGERHVPKLTECARCHDSWLREVQDELKCVNKFSQQFLKTGTLSAEDRRVRIRIHECVFPKRYEILYSEVRSGTCRYQVRCQQTACSLLSAIPVYAAVVGLRVAPS